MAARRLAATAARIALAVVLVAGGALAGAYFLLNSRAGLDAVARQIERAARDGGVVLRIRRIDGNLLSDFTIEGIALADARGSFAAIERVAVRWRPLALTGRTLAIDRIAVTRAALERAPEIAAAAGAGRKGGGLPALGLDLRLGGFSIDRLALATPLLGDAQAFALRASAELAADGGRARMTAALRAEGTAEDGAFVDLDYGATQARFALKGWVREPRGGPVGRLAGLAAGAPLAVEIDGTGPAGGWHGRLTAAAGGIGRADIALGAAAGPGGLSLTLTGTADPAQALPPKLRPLVAPRLSLDAALDVEGNRAVVVRRFAAQSSALTLSGEARVGLADGALSGRATAETRTRDVLSLLTAPAAVGHASVKARLGGTLAAPAIEADVVAERLSAGPVAARSLSGTARIVLPGGEPGEATLRARLHGLAAADPALAGALGQDASISADALITGDGAVPSLVAAVASGGARLDFDGAVNEAGAVSGGYEIALNDFGPALRAAGAGAGVGGTLRASGTIEAAGSSVRTTVSGALDGLRGADPRIAELLGTRPEFSGVVETRDGVTIDVTRLDGKLAAGTVATRGRIDTARRTLAARVTADAPQLAPLSPLAGVALAGSARLVANVTGPLATPGVQASLRTERLRIAGRPVESAYAGVGLRLVAAGAVGSLRWQAGLRGAALTGSAAFAVRGRSLDLSDIVVAHGMDRIAGRARVDLARGTLGGSLQGTLGDLRPLSALAGQEVSGRAGVRLEFADGGAAGQGASLAVEARDLVPSAGVAISKATLSARIADAFGAFRLSARATAAGARAGDAALESLEASAEGTAASLAWTARGKGAWRGPLALDGAGTLALGKNGVADLSVSRLAATVMGQAIALRGPAKLGIAADSVKLDGLALGIAGGTLEGRGRLAPGGVELALTVREIPARLAAAAAPSLDLAGTVSGRVAVSGAPTRPSVEAAFDVAGLGPAGGAKKGEARFRGSASLRQTDTGLSVDARMEGPDDTRLAFSAHSDTTLSLAPFGLGAPDRAALSGKLDARMRLDLLDRMVGLGEDRLSGRLEAAATLGGTIAKPALRGTASLAGGFYEGAATGVVLRNASARIEFAGERVRLVSLSGDDGNGGKISGSGAFHLSDAGDADLKVTFRDFHAIRRPEADAAVSGALAFSGGLAAPVLSGDLTVDRAEIRIPEKLPEDVVVLDVEDVNLPADRLPRAKPAHGPPAGRALKAALRLAVKVPGKAFVRGRGLDSEWAGALKVSGDTRTPRIEGALKLVRGTFAFAGKSFKIASGEVTFLPDRPGEPEISAVAETKLEEHLARITISGKASSPKLAVSSEPPLPQEEILARILFGKSTGQLTVIQAARLAETAVTLSGAGGATGIVDRVRQALGVDVLDVEPGQGEAQGASLKAGKYVSDKVFLSVKQGTQPGSQRVGVEIEVLPNVSVESDIGAAADSNVGINWKWNY